MTTIGLNAALSKDHHNAAMPASKFIIVGGCHVAGYNIDNHPPFWTDAARSYGSDDLKIISRVTMKNAVKELDEYDESLGDSVAIVQLGHFDIFRELSLLNPVARIRESISKKISSRGNGVTSSQTPDRKPHSSSFLLSSFAKGMTMSALDCILIKRMKRKEALNNLQDDFEKVIEKLKKLGVKNIFVLSPFPTATPRINRYRIILSKFMKAYCQDNGVVFIDVWRSLGFSFGAMTILRKGTTLDGLHLSKHGHDIVAQMLTSHVKAKTV